jgi:TATA-binding protein-associated factor
MLAAREGQRKFIAQLVGDQPLEPYAVPFSLSTPLRRYQQDGVNWLAFLRSFRLHGILCDEMGLGKTLTTLCIIVGDAHDRKQAHLKAKSNESAPLPSLVVCPATLVGHWHDEVHKHCQSPISAVQYVGAPRLREALRSSLLGADVVIVSYETVRTDIEFLASFCFNYCVLDEGHTIRNSKTKVTQAVKRLVSNHRLILSGTPVQNSALELWSMFDFLMPGFLGTERQFNERFSRAIDSSKLQKHAGDKAILAMEGLHRQVLPFILGRTKQQVLSDLPPKIIQDVMCDISPLQKRLYDQFEKSTPCRNAVASLAKSGTSAPGNVLQSLQYMRKVCNHPALVLTDSHPLRASIVAELESSGSSLRDLQHAPKLIALRCEYTFSFFCCSAC